MENTQNIVLGVEVNYQYKRDILFKKRCNMEKSLWTIYCRLKSLLFKDIIIGMVTEENTIIFKENAIDKIKEYININFADIKTIALGDKIYIIPKEDTSIKIIFKE